MENYDLVFKDRYPDDALDDSSTAATLDAAADTEEQQKAADWQNWFRQNLIIELAAGDIGRDLLADLDDVIAEAVNKSLVELASTRERVARLEGQLAAMTALLGVKADAFGDLKGERGPQGPRGERGAKGERGRDGRDAATVKEITFSNANGGAIALRMSDGTPRGPRGAFSVRSHFAKDRRAAPLGRQNCLFLCSNFRRAFPGRPVLSFLGDLAR